MAVTLVQILNNIESTLDDAITLSRSQSYDQLTEGMTDADLPLLQVYPESNTPEQVGEGTSDRSTFGGPSTTPVRRKHYIVHADYYATHRKEIGQDMARLVAGIDAMENVLEAIDVKPYFGLAGIQAFSWSWSRVTFICGDPTTPYVGARFIIHVWVY